MPMFTAYLLRTCGESWQRSGMFRTALVLWSFFFVLLGIIQCTTFLYCVTPDNHFYRGPRHPLLMAPMITLLLLNLAGVIRRRGKLPQNTLPPSSSICSR